MVTSTLDHLNSTQDSVVRETLGFLASLLFNGNEDVQVRETSPIFSPINSKTCKFKKDTFTVYCLIWQYMYFVHLFHREKRGIKEKKISIWHRLAQWFNCIEETFFFHNTKRKQEKSDGSNLICISWNHGLSFLQNSLIAYFTGTREETFFFAIKSRIHMSALATREK